MSVNTATKVCTASAPLTFSKAVSVTGAAWPETVSRCITLSKVVTVTRRYMIPLNIISRDEVRGIFDISDDELMTVGIEVYSNASETLNNASVEITEATAGLSHKYLYLVENGVTVHSLKLGNFSTLGELVNRVNSYDRWTCRLFGPSEASPTDLVNCESTQCLEYSNRVVIDLINNWKVDFWIQAVTDTIERECRRSLVRRTLVETYDGDGQCYLQVKNYPIDSVMYLKVDDDAVTSTNYEIYYDEGVIYYESGFTQDERNIEVKYAAGYSDKNIPFALKRIALDLFSFVWNRVPKDLSISKEKIGSYSYQMANGLTEDMKEQLSLFTAYGIQDAIRS